jgi:hypothetical protein
MNETGSASGLVSELDDGLAVGACPDNITIAERPLIATAGA